MSSDNDNISKEIKKLKTEMDQVKEICTEELSTQEYFLQVEKFKQKWETLEQDSVKDENEAVVNNLEVIDRLKTECSKNLNEVKENRKLLLTGELKVLFWIFWKLHFSNFCLKYYYFRSENIFKPTKYSNK